MSKNILHLDPHYDGACPCAEFEYQGLMVSVHCWRSTGLGDCDCEYSGIHVYGDSPAKIKEIGELVKEQVEYIWSNTEWKLVLHVT